MDKLFIPKRGMTSEGKKTLSFFAYISPWLIGFAAFTLIPLVLSLVYSFTDVKMATYSEGFNFIGLKNYYLIFTSDQKFLTAIGNTFIFTFAKVVILVILSLLTALLLNSKIIGRKAFRILIYLPALIPAVSSAFLMRLFFSNGTENIANYFLSFLGIAPVNFLGDNASSLGTMIFVSIWTGLGPTMIIFLAAIQGVDTSVMEAADLDGAGPIRKFLHIIVPTILPVMFFVILTSAISSLQVYTEAVLLTKGTLPTMSSVIYDNAFNSQGNTGLGYACAQGWIVFALTFVFTLIYIWNMNRTQKVK